MQLTRRRLLQAMAALPVVASARGGTTPILVRYDIASAQGAQMLEIYAAAVAEMENLGADNPLSWLWQWYTHFVDGATTKANEIGRLFGPGDSTTRALAEDAWNTCQSHAGQNANHFLPWHRMFVYYLERIVRHVSGNSAFTLPYWNYTSTDPARRGVVPLQFRLPDDPLYRSLYRPNRSVLANAGEPIHKNQPTDVMDISDAMASPSYSSANDVQGFCRAIDSGIHGRIHVLVGNSKGMGAVPYAGNDPLFWVHHANIDRMWASWNRNGGANPTDAALAPWIDTVFVMADGNGQRVARPLRDFMSAQALGYGYDQYLARPTEATPSSPLRSGKNTWRTQVSGIPLPGNRKDGKSATAASPVVASATTTAELGAAPTRLVLRPTADATGARVLGLDPTGRQRTRLVLKNLHAWRQPEVLYHVYVLPQSGGQPDGRHHAGNINFFDAEFHDHGHGSHGTALGENFYSFDITPILQRIAASGSSPSSLQVVLVPAGAPRQGAKPLVASIYLTQH